MAEKKPCSVGPRRVVVPADVYDHLLEELRAGRPAYTVDKFGKKSLCELRDGRDITEVESGYLVVSFAMLPSKPEWLTMWSKLLTRYGQPIIQRGDFSVFAKADGRRILYCAANDSVIFAEAADEACPADRPSS